eukprot:jgi/Mesvir1/26749/Mv20525-RA.1
MNNSSGSVPRGVTEEDLKRRVRRNRAQSSGLGVAGWVAIAALVAGVVALIYYSNQGKVKETVQEGAFVGGGPVEMATPFNEGGHVTNAFRMGQTNSVPGSKPDFFSTFNSFLG